MTLIDSERKLLNYLTQSIIQGMIEEKIQRGESPDIKWMNKTGFHFRIKKREKVVNILNKIIYSRKKLKIIEGNPKVIPFRRNTYM